MSDPPPRVWPVFVTYAAVLAGVQIIGGAIAVALILGRALQEPALFSASTDVSALVMDLVSTPGATIASVALTEAVLAAVPLVAVRISKSTAAALLRTGRARASAAGLAAMVVGPLAVSTAAGSAVALLGGMRWTLSLQVLERSVAKASTLELAGLFLAIGVAAPLGEELFFRGFMQTRLSQRWGARRGILITAALFGILHLDPVHAPIAFLIGIYLGWIVEVGGSIWPAIAAHAVNNITSVALSRAFPGAQSNATQAVMLGASVVVLIGCVAVVRRWGERPRER